MLDKLFLFILFLVIAYWVYTRWCCVHSTLYTGGKDVIKDLKKHPRSKSEQSVITDLEHLTGKKFPTVNPDWLLYDGKTLELDGYNEELSLALEFSGPLHTKWFPKKESYEKYIQRVEKDAFKRKKCEERGVRLIVIDTALPRHLWKPYLQSRLYDFKMGDAPVHYVNEMHVEPWRKNQ